MAMYQLAADSKQQDNIFSSGVMEESEVCSVPGGLASIRAQFETQETATSHNVTEFLFHHRAVQEVELNSELTMRSSSREVIPASQQAIFHQDEQVDRLETSVSSHDTIEDTSAVDYENTEYFPPPPPEDLEYLPPPPPDLLQVPSESPDMPVECYYSPEPPESAYPSKCPLSRQEYFRQRNQYELKRLYKHIHPEVRKNLEMYSDAAEYENTRQGSQEEFTGETRYIYEDNGSSPNDCISPEEEYLEWDEILRGEVQSMRWMFENKPLDAIKDDASNEDDAQNMEQEMIVGSDVRSKAWMFETKPMDTLGSDNIASTKYRNRFNKLDKGDVRAAAWLFENQPMETLNKMHGDEELTKEIVFTQEDGSSTIYMLESQYMDTLGHTETIDDSHLLSLRSALEDIKGEVKTITSTFETQFICVLMGQSGQMLEITSIRKVETVKGETRTSTWLFDTQALDMTNRLPAPVKLVCSLSMEDNYKGDVYRGRWLFETKTLDSINTDEWESSSLQKEEIIGADVRKHCLAFETQPMDSLKDDSNARPPTIEEVIGGNVRSAKHYFETAPADNLKDLAEVGKLQKMVRLDEEKGDVRHQKWVFESQPLEHIQEEKKEVVRTINLEEIDKVDVSNYKQIFETTDLTRWDESQKILVEGVTCGSVKSNKHLFESTPMYAMQDSSGHYHEVKTVHREEVVKGNVTSCKWMFETRPIDQFDESITNYQIIKGISKEVESGDVKTAKWLFETQPLDAIKYFSNIEDEETTTKESVEIVKGDVKTGKWLFETKLMNVPYEKDELTSENESEEVHKGDVKTCTWLFETKALDTIRDETETVLQTCTVNQEDVQGKNVRMARFLFETEKLENITGEDESFKRVTDIDIQSGDVNRIKYIFENQSSDIMTSTSEEVMQMLKTTQSEDIQKGNVVNCKWLFENQSIDAIHDTQEEALETRTVMDVQGGNVDKGRFIFETYSLDKIQEVSSETETDITKLQKITREEEEKGDVRNYTMMFETQPLYAIQDKQGHYHEVTTVTSEEILKGDVIGSRWLFETKPLDSIRDTDEVYIIKSVTQEDVQKGDVTSAKWRFETQPLDTIAEDIKMSVKTVEDIQGGDVRMNKQRFESDELSQKSVRTVNVSEIQKGDVRTAKWMFETQTMDKIRSQSEENLIETVMKEEVLKGDVRQSVWLFEQNPLDHIKEVDEDNTVVVQEEIPKADVKTTTWLFETTPFHDFNENSVEKSEILGKSIKGTLEELYSQKMVNSKGILIEADEIGDVRMAKYQLMNTDSPEIQREEILSGDLNNIMMNLLNRRETIERGVVVESEEKGNISTTVHQLFNQERGINVEKEEILRGDIQEAVNNLLKEGGSAKRGILLQEDEKGDVQMTIYSLLNKQEDISVEKEDIIKGNIRNALQRLSNPENQEQMRIKVDETEKGNVNFYSTCIESGALDYLKQLQVEPDETPPEKIEKEKIIRGDIKGTKLILGSNRAQIERTVVEEDIVCGDVRKSVKVFMSEPTLSLDGLQKEEIVRGDLKAAMNSLSQSVNQTVVVEKEEVVRGNIHETRRHLECAHRLPKEVEKTEIVHGNIKGALKSLEKSATSKVEVVIEDLVPGDIKGTLKSLEQAKQTVRAIEKEEIVKGNIHTAKQCLRDASNDRRTCQQEIDVQGNVRGTIELLLEPPASPRMTRRPSFEGDVKMSIKSLYETHEVHETGEEQTQPEKEEVIKGDVKGTIKSLLESAQRAAPKIRVGARRVKVPVRSPLRSQHGSPLSRSQHGSPLSRSQQAPEKVVNQPIKVEKLTPETNVKSGKKKKAKGTEKQVEVKETKQPDETKTGNMSQVKDVKVEVKEVTKLKVSSEQTHAQTDVKVKEDSQKAPAIKDNQPATPTSARKKKKRKSKAKDAAATTESTKSPSESSTQSQEIQTAHQVEQIQVHKEVIIPESKVERKVNQSVQQQGTVKVEKRVEPSQRKKELTGSQQIQEKPKEEYRNVPVKVESGKMTNITEDSQRREHVQKLISHITELEGASGKIDSKSVKTLLNTIPEWLIGPEENLYLEGTAVEHNIQKLTEMVSYVKKRAKAKLMCLEGIHTNLEKREYEPTSEKIIVGGATQRIHKISIGSLKVESQKKVVESKATSHESKMQEMRSPSPLLRMRSPSPTFITIESTRRTDSPQRTTPSPILTHRPATPPTPPPRKSETPTTRINRATPSPTFSRAENLARLKDTTAKLSRGVTPPPVSLPMQVTEKKSEIVESPASFHRQIKIEAHAEGTSEVSDTTIVTQEAQKAGLKVTDKESFHQTDKEVMEASEMSDLSMVTMSVRNKREFFEDAQKAEVNKTNVRKDPIDSPEHLGPDREEPKTTKQESKDDTQSTSEKVTENNAEIVGSAKSTDKELTEASKMSNSLAATTSVRDKREFFEEAHKAKVNKMYVRRDPIDIPERLGPDMEELKPENQENEKEDLPKVDLSGLVNKFETPEDTVYIRKPMRERRGSEMEYTETGVENTVTQEEEMPTFDIKAIKNVFEMVEQSPSFKGEKNKQEELESNLTDPTGFSEKSVTEHFSSLDEFGNKTIGSLSSTTVSQHSESIITHHAPFSYADVVKKKKGSEVTTSESPEEASTEELLRNFHKTWTESESVFKSLGYSVSEERTSHVVSHQTKTVVTAHSPQKAFKVDED
ncbi:xin actin-binding repeat-containing protein 2-like [Salvelinus namaycush]|uniref:Xin actin-binding repeat-containing protein 2-like n=1 Tax=Salvelinus namaycush TaxID=8040 RepID=A0A8U1ERU5_SALNM|nr:xin actin-binding repeat-containing protein 2-like [Salvelinus namaycush]